MPRRSPVVLSVLAVCAAVPLRMVASCQGGAIGSAASSGGGGSFIGLFDSGALGGGCPDAASEAGDAGDDGSTGCEGVEGGVTYHDVGAILAGCQGELCHAAPTFSSTVDVAAYECCDGRLLVDPGNAAKSYLLDKVEGVDLCAGVPMPKGGPPLSDADILTLRRWVCEGAPGP